jgi:hypothetical protein
VALEREVWEFLESIGRSRRSFKNQVPLGRGVIH